MHLRPYSNTEVQAACLPACLCQQILPEGPMERGDLFRASKFSGFFLLLTTAHCLDHPLPEVEVLGTYLSPHKTLIAHLSPIFKTGALFGLSSHSPAFFFFLLLTTAFFRKEPTDRHMPSPFGHLSSAAIHPPSTVDSPAHSSVLKHHLPFSTILFYLIIQRTFER